MININVLKKVERRTCVIVDGSEEHDKLMQILENFGYTWSFGIKPTDDNYNKRYPIILLYPDYKIYKIKRIVSDYVKYNFSDFFDNKKRIRKPNEDPFDEENWGYVQENNDIDLKNYTLEYDNFGEMMYTAKYLHSKGYGVYNYYSVIQEKPEDASSYREFGIYVWTGSEFARTIKCDNHWNKKPSLKLASNKKKIRKPEDDPFDEEIWWEEIKENMSFNILRGVEKRTCVNVEKSIHHNHLMQILEDFGYLWGSDAKPTTDTYRSDYPIIVIYPNKKIYKSNFNHESNENSVIYDFSDFLGGKKIKNPEIDPFGEENWGYVQESVDYEILKKYDYVFNNKEEMAEMAEILSKYYKVFNYYDIVRYREIHDWKFFKLEGKEFTRNSGYPYKPMNLEGLKNLILREEKTKIRKPEIDPFGEENWGYVQENIKTKIGDLKQYAIEYYNSEEMREVARTLKDLGFDVFRYARVMQEEDDYDDNTWKIHGLYVCSGSMFSRASLDDKNFNKIPRLTLKDLNKKTKIKNVELDPFGEENWGYVQEKLDPFFHNTKSLSIRIHTEEEYIKLMKILEQNNFLWASGHKPTEWPYKGEKVIDINISGVYNIPGTIYGQSLRSHNRYIQNYDANWRPEPIPYSVSEFLSLLQGYDNIPKRRQVSKPDIDPFSEEKWWEMKSFKNFNKEEIVNESTDNEDDIKFEDDIFEFGDIGEIRYRTYEDGVIIFMGSHVDKKYRGQGIFKSMLEGLFAKFKGMDVYVPISNKNIIDMFSRMGFKIIKEPIRYWGKPKNTTNMHKKF